MICNRPVCNTVVSDVDFHFGISAEHPTCISKCIHVLNYSSLELMMCNALEVGYVDTIYCLLKTKIKDYLAKGEKYDRNIFECVINYPDKNICAVVVRYVIRYIINSRSYSYNDQLFTFLHNITIDEKISVKNYVLLISRVKISTRSYMNLESWIREHTVPRNRINHIYLNCKTIDVKLSLLKP